MVNVSNRLLPGAAIIGLIIVSALQASTALAEEPAKTTTKTVARPATKPAAEPTEPAAENKTEKKDDLAEILAGHSYHGEVFNEGPRQKAYLMGGTGHVKFPVTTKNPQAQKFFEQGVGQLYGFWYLEAERSFRHAASLDPDCAMAYWGAAMANLGNPKRSKGFIEEAITRKDKADAREVMYINAAKAYITTVGKNKRNKRNDAYTKAMENIILKYPDDLEAKAFLALHLYLSRKSSTSYFAVDALLQDIFDVEPMHSAHHFRIHLWDDRDPQTAVSSAALCGQTSPSIAHMWHMPGHIFSRLNRYEDAAWQQEASARVDHAHMMRDRVMPDRIGNFAHNNEWFIRNLIHVGRVHDAVDLAKNMTELPRHPRINTFGKRGSAYYGRQRLLQVLSTYELWNDLIALAKTSYLEPTEVEKEQITLLRHLGLAYFQTGDIAGGETQLADLEIRLAAVEAKRDEAVKVAEETMAKEKAAKEKAAEEKSPEDKNTEDKAADDEAAKDKATENKTETSKKNETKTAKAGESKTPAGKPVREKPARKKSGAKRRDDAATLAHKKFVPKIKPLQSAVNALKGYRAIAKGEHQNGYDLLKKAGGVDPLQLARAQYVAGDEEKAEKAIRKNVKANKNEVHPLAILVDILWQSEQKEEAGKVFDELRKLSGPIDLDTPVFARLAPIAKELGHDADWRVAQSLADDIGERPELDTLGPFRWRPSAAPEWALKDADGKMHSSADFKGQPHIVIFYLGYGCLHCAEQLQKFAPKVKEFEEAGLKMVAISTDDQEGLKVSIKNYDKGKMPIPLVADAELDIFKAYRVMDDFENQPLHGTFIIDGNGMVLWQDISYEPFMDPDFVLREATRLLAQTPALESSEKLASESAATPTGEVQAETAQ